MARGWESKAVEDQIADAERRASADVGQDVTPDMRERQAKKMTLSLSRSKILEDLQRACDRRYRAGLERALEDVEAALRALD